MKGTKEILAALAVGFILIPAVPAQARHASVSGAVTIVHADRAEKNLQVKGGADTKLLDRVKNILQAQEDKKGVSGTEVEQKSRQGLVRWDMNSRDEGGTLLFSDSPECVNQNGILYQDSVQGDARVLFYHLNSSDEVKKLAVVLKNEYRGKNTVTITRGGSGQPSSDYLEVGKATQLEYFSQEWNQKLVLQPGTSQLLQESMNMTLLQPGDLTYGVFDFHAEHPVLVSVIMLDAYGDPVTAAEELPVLPKDDMRLRGTFKGMNRVLSARKVYNPGEDGGVFFMLADDKSDKYRTGIDATDGSSVTNYGNYGINYRIELPIQTGDVDYYLSPLGGVYAGAMRSFQATKTYTLFPTPGERTFFGDRTSPESYTVQAQREAGKWQLAQNTELAPLGESVGQGETVFEFSPPGASNLPVAVVMLPKK